MVSRARHTTRGRPRFRVVMDRCSPSHLHLEERKAPLRDRPSPRAGRPRRYRIDSLGVPRVQKSLANRQPREHVATRAGGGDQKAHVFGCTPAWAMLTRMPSAAIHAISAVLPNEMNGRAMPVIGMTPRTPPMLTDGLKREPDGDPRRNHPAEPIRRPDGDRPPGEREHDEETDHRQRPDQPGLLADDGEDEVGVGVGQIEPPGAAGPQSRPRRSRRSTGRNSSGSAGNPRRWSSPTGRGTRRCGRPGTRH